LQFSEAFHESQKCSQSKQKRTFYETVNYKGKLKMVKKTGSVMVVGGGIAGMQAALDLADSGFYVYLVERSSSIGGIMAQLDKTFPTNDCSM
jgi:heterodisulfide reductase subunit A